VGDRSIGKTQNLLKEAGGRRQEAGGRRQEAGGRRQEEPTFKNVGLK
jgi:hypothetical protein